MVNGWMIAVALLLIALFYSLGLLDPVLKAGQMCSLGDGISCTEDECEMGVCSHALVVCQDGWTCNAANGKCVELSPCPQGCKDSETCKSGVCVPKPTPTCGPGTAFDPTTLQCVIAKADAECVDKTIQCKVFETTSGLISGVGECFKGNWLLAQPCGDETVQVCIGSACVAAP